MKISKDKLNSNFQKFLLFIYEESGQPYSDFKENTLLIEMEGYKEILYHQARQLLSANSWKEDTFGKGFIRDNIITSIEQDIPRNNLVLWQAKYGEQKTDHYKIKTLKNSELFAFELESYKFYRNESDDSHYFNFLINAIGKKYSLIAFLFFIKNNTRYLPISSTKFDSFFHKIGLTFRTSRLCSWENYNLFLKIIKDIREFINAEMDSNISLLDAHSFCWIIENQMENWKQGKKSNITINKNRLSIINTRIGQTSYRNQLLLKWNNCSSVGKLNKPDILIASHIKPWRDSSVIEALDPNNGLLLPPNIDYLFDKGYITFDFSGKIVISKLFDSEYNKEIGLNENIRIAKYTAEINEYMEYHRENIFQRK